MSTQDVTGVSLTLVAETDRQHLRLLELPPEILSLLTSDNPPTLELKSSEGQSDQSAGHAVLCTPNKTFNLRQKNSSNTVYLLTPHERTDSMAGPALQAIAQCRSSLELTTYKTSDTSALAVMRSVLPVHSSTGIPSSSAVNMRTMFDCMPFSEHECVQAFGNLAAFEHPDTGNVYRPSAALALQVWREILNAATAESIDLTGHLSNESLAALTADVSALDKAITQAVLGVFVDPDSGKIDIDRCVVWSGQTLLEAEVAQAEMSSKLLLEKWKDSLPESWRPLAEISKLAAVSQMSDNGRSIILKRSIAATSTAASEGNAAANNTSGGTKRKWHEKFRPSKK